MHSNATIAQLAVGIMEFGFIDPTVVVSNSGIVASQKRGYCDAN
jgi:hypothetical protein